MKRSAIWLLLFYTSLTAYSGQGYPVYSMLRQNTFKICRPDGGCGTAYNVEYRKKRYLVTNWHVCQDSVEMRVYSESRVRKYRTTVIGSFGKTDLCVLNPVAEGGLKLGVTPNSSMPIYTAGYPSTGGGKLVLNGGYTEYRDRKCATDMEFDEYLCPPEFWENSACIGVYDEYFTTLPGWYGASGSPVVNSRGEVVGTVNIKNGEVASKATAAFIPVDHLKEILDSFETESP